MRGRDTAIISEKAGKCNKNRLAYAGRFLVGDGGFTPSGHKLRLHPPTNKNTDHPDGQSVFLVGDGGFEPPKALPADLQSVPFGHSGNPPYTIWNWSWWTDSNPRPADYKSAALPAELHQHLTSEPYYNRGFPECQQKSSTIAQKFIALKLCNLTFGSSGAFRAPARNALLAIPPSQRRRATSITEGGKGSSAPAGAGNGFPRQ